MLLDVTSLSKGLDIAEGITNIVVPRNTTVPCRIEQQYTTYYDYQTTVDIVVYEGERKFSKDNHWLGAFTLKDIKAE